MRKGKYVRESTKKNVCLFVISIFAIVVVAAVVLIIQPWMGKQSEAETDNKNSNLENNPFFEDLSCSGTITDVDGEICFVSDQMYCIEVDGELYDNVNIFCLNDPNYQSWAEQTVTVRTASITRSDDKFMLDLQYIITDDVCVSTPFSDFHFPAEWADRLIVKHSYSDTSYKVNFYADMDADQEYLFSIVMGVEDGIPIGKLTDDMDAVTMVYLLNKEDDFSGYSQTEQDYLHGMMEGINYLLDELENNPNFSSEF